MPVVIIHSHLNPGGVTRIIQSQIDSLEGEEIKVLVGACPDAGKITSPNAELHIIPELDYLERRKYTDQEAMEMLHKIHSEIRDYITPDTVLHFHNLNLGKNPIVTYAVYLLAKEGVKVFNHAHDFAEDRPSNYAFLEEIIYGNFSQNINEVLYPKLPNYHFGVLNSFDFERLQGLGVTDDRIEWLPNPVTFNASGDLPEKTDAKKAICEELNIDANKLLVTYPVRVIQRKNIGEFILLSILFRHRANFAVTQPPQNPVEIEMYNQWIKFCNDNEIDIVFEAGKKVNFEKLLRGTDFCITTSYKEGFGMVYLEPWLLDTPVVGRDIDFITRDFKNDGFSFPTLYYKLNIPGIKTDFKDLNLKMQMEIIQGVVSGKIEKHKLFEQNPILNTLFSDVKSYITEKNKTIIKNNYSLQGYGIKLQKRYKKMVG
ncbi:glycosyltransferase family protein [Draconibacterium halophilum]|uniref:Glycosyltransferase family 4 protein n=1 Tax=Draconibacterium halophilum TaxID=2706887 RepID=A0A6C0RDK2_9BACT|nr:glycosyltransferase family 4 protein [Draconibacterium halophilum]QIA08137.1 glycosyltransferase family 4 protein [Draconibacterium halophilum]